VLETPKGPDHRKGMLSVTTTEVYAPEPEKVSCPHCVAGWVFEPTDDPLEDEAMECPACLGTARRMHRAERLAIRAERDLDVQFFCLERMGG
jgi:hypothetical protein